MSRRDVVKSPRFYEVASAATFPAARLSDSTTGAPQLLERRSAWKDSSVPGSQAGLSPGARARRRSPDQRCWLGEAASGGRGGHRGIRHRRPRRREDREARSAHAFGEAGDRSRRLPEVRLEAVDTGALLRRTTRPAERVTKVLRFGIGRDVALSVQDGNWYDAGGRQAACGWPRSPRPTPSASVSISRTSACRPAPSWRSTLPPGAIALRGVVKSGSPRFDPDRNVEFFDAAGPRQRGEFWTGTFSGERARVEYLAPAGGRRRAALHRGPAAAHLPRSGGKPRQAAWPRRRPAPATTTCPASPSGRPRRAVSGIGFIGWRQLLLHRPAHEQQRSGRTSLPTA